MCFSSLKLFQYVFIQFPNFRHYCFPPEKWYFPTHFKTSDVRWQEDHDEDRVNIFFQKHTWRLFRFKSVAKRVVILMFLAGLMERHQSTSILSQQAPDRMDKVCCATVFIPLMICLIEFDKRKKTERNFWFAFTKHFLPPPFIAFV